jgi:hypothetical protein
MPVDLKWEARGVVRQFSGFVSAEEFVASAHRIECHPDFDRFDYLIDDFTAARGNGIDAEALEEVAAIGFGARSSNNALRVVVVTPDESDRRQAQSMKGRPAGRAFDTTVVPTMAEARAVLGLGAA